MQKEVSWRDSYDYRPEYLRDRPGFFGHLHICAQCKKMLWGAGSIQVDHVVPPSIALKRAKGGAGFWRRLFTGEKKGAKRGQKLENTNLLAEAMNTKINLVACCPACNLAKSDKVGFVTVQGVTAKILEETIYTIQRVSFLSIGLVRLGINRFPYPKNKKKKKLSKLIPSARKPGFLQTLFAVIIFLLYTVVRTIIVAVLRIVKFILKHVYPIVKAALLLIFATLAKPLRTGSVQKRVVISGCYLAVVSAVIYPFI